MLLYRVQLRAVFTESGCCANNDMKAYIRGVETYLVCAGLPRSDERKELDDLKKLQTISLRFCVHLKKIRGLILSV